jgi:hypothetical protein
MSARALLQRVIGRGIAITSSKGQLEVRPRALLTDELRGEIRSAKAGLIQFVRPHRCWRVTKADEIAFELVCVPAASRAELELLYGEQVILEPLPEDAASAPSPNEREELEGLVGAHYGGHPDYVDALAAALRDPQAALMHFRALVIE